MTRSTNMEHVEVLRELEQDGDAGLTEREREAIRQVIASLSAPQPLAEVQPVAWEWEYIGVDQYPRGHKVARSLREMDPTNPPYPETWRPTRPLIYGDTAPPSAPVGVEELVRDLVREIEHNTCTHEDTRRGGSIWEICDACGAEWADDRGGKPDFKWPDCVERAHSWIAQQPAVVDEAMVEAVRHRVGCHDGLDITPAQVRSVLKHWRIESLAAQPGGSDNDR